ncbi:hypothetical protein NS220_06785 [Microbacterium testaceum]|uniref:Uncharacterized protein n=1 Tax=Microbacterium testaceum TaxID=2033 RepID=A0A147EYF3_MICTE|nr:hypothetical protein NS220_06785 [Microbacterium testaceum]
MSTGDTEKDALWELSLQELQDILDDPSDKRHEKARLVAEEMFAPIRRAMSAMYEPQLAAFRAQFARLAGNLLPPEQLRTDDSEWMRAIQPHAVLPLPGVDVYEIEPDTTAGSIAVAAASLSKFVEAQQDSAESTSAERQQDRKVEGRRHVQMLAVAILGVVATVAAIVIPTAIAINAANKPPRTSPAACGRVPAAWAINEAVAERGGRTSTEARASSETMLTEWADATNGAPSWSVEIVSAARDAYEESIFGDVYTSERAAQHAAARDFLATFTEECQSEGNLPDDYRLP